MGKELDFETEEVDQIEGYFLSKGFTKRITYDGDISMTAQGVDYIEDQRFGLNHPDRLNLIANNLNVFFGGQSGSIDIQQGS